MGKKRLIWQIYPPYLVITLIALVAVSLYASSELRHFFLKQAEDDLHRRARLLSLQIGRQLSPLDEAAIDKICKTTGRKADTRITVILSSGRVVGDTMEMPVNMENHGGREEIRRAIESGYGSAVRYSNTLKQRMMYVAIPVSTGTAAEAVIRTSLPVTHIDDEIGSIRIRIALGGLLVALFAAGLSLIVSRRISRPIEEMKAGAVLFSEGSLGHRLSVPDSEELGGLAEALNMMAAQMDDRLKTVIDQRNELETVLSSMTEGVIAIDSNEHVISMNPAAAAMFNTSATGPENRTIQEVIRIPDIHRFVREALLSEEKRIAEISLFQETERILSIHSMPLRDVSEKRIGILIVFNDVTELKRLENMRRDFVANVSHEIKTPLTAIKGFVETLQLGDVETAEEKERFLGIISHHVDRLSAIVDDLLNLSRIEREDEEKTIHRTEVQIRPVIQSAIGICRPKADGRGIALDLVAGDLSIVGRIDPSLIEQALVNLLDNAIKYSNRESRVEVSATVAGADIRIEVRDHGIGISREHLPRLFERFYRVDKARSRKLGGTGLGLSIVKHIVHAHGGEISVESTPGAGSIFTLHLPKS